MGKFRHAAGLIVLASVALAAAPAEALFHLWTIAEIYSNADGSVQFIELVSSGSAENQSDPAEIRTDSGNVYQFPAWNLTGSTLNKRLLIATDNFESLPGAVTPNFANSPALPPNFFNPVGDRIRLYHPNVFPQEFHSRTFTNVPTDNVFSRVFTPSVTNAANSPTNFAGATGSINRGDYDKNGVVDAADYVVWRKTLTQSASPAGSGADGSTNGTIDAADYTLWRARFGNLIAGAASGAGGRASVPEPSTIISLLIGLIAPFLSRRKAIATAASRRVSASIQCRLEPRR